MIMEGDPSFSSVRRSQRSRWAPRAPPLHAPSIPIGRTFEAAIALAREAGFLGEGILGGAHIEPGPAGAREYICGETLLESLEGKRGMVRSSRRCPQSRACSANRR
jgi:hypothetical protein